MEVLIVKFYITGTRRGLGKYLSDNLVCVDRLEDCDVFINCKHDQFTQVDMLYQAAKLNKRIINIGSNAADWLCADNDHWKYSVEKMALDNTNEILFYRGINTTIIRFGWIDTERVESVKEPKISKQYALDLILWILLQPYKIKEMTVTP